MSICLHVLLYTTSMPDVPRGQKKVLNALELGSPVVMRFHLVLETEPQSSERAASVFFCVEPSLQTILKHC